VKEHNRFAISRRKGCSQAGGILEGEADTDFGGLALADGQ